ncbi:hypothetical protein PR001_g20832 [Phytophthora rubi]|uniref:HMA domain-containing protein n=1 Tax=Phytophthora rubi TaxID=129364 RepID=A0A6A3JL71_9STRA|nr:hypothetical protein PR001_g20832 [Phytophthora rubi]
MEGVVAGSVDFETNTASVLKANLMTKRCWGGVVRRLSSTFNARLIRTSRLSGVKTAENGGAQQRKTLPVRENDCVISSEVSLSIDEADTRAIVKVTLLIGGMTCNSCANTVEGSLECTEGVVSAFVSFTTEKVIVQFDRDVVSVQALVEAVEDVGYGALCIPGDEQSRRRNPFDRWDDVQLVLQLG